MKLSSEKNRIKWEKKFRVVTKISLLPLFFVVSLSSLVPLDSGRFHVWDPLHDSNRGRQTISVCPVDFSCSIFLGSLFSLASVWSCVVVQSDFADVRDPGQRSPRGDSQHEGGAPGRALLDALGWRGGRQHRRSEVNTASPRGFWELQSLWTKFNMNQNKWTSITFVH